MKIYEIGYTALIPGWGNCHTTRYVKADSEKEALSIASSKLKIDITELNVVGEIKTIN